MLEPCPKKGCLDAPAALQRNCQRGFSSNSSHTPCTDTLQKGCVAGVAHRERKLQKGSLKPILSTRAACSLLRSCKATQKVCSQQGPL